MDGGDRDWVELFFGCVRVAGNLLWVDTDGWWQFLDDWGWVNSF